MVWKVPHYYITSFLLLYYFQIPKLQLFLGVYSWSPCGCHPRSIGLSDLHRSTLAVRWRPGAGSRCHSYVSYISHTSRYKIWHFACTSIRGEKADRALNVSGSDNKLPEFYNVKCKTTWPIRLTSTYVVSMSRYIFTINCCYISLWLKLTFKEHHVRPAFVQLVCVLWKQCLLINIVSFLELLNHLITLFFSWE